ncbi:ThiF family adenylyltransferase [Microbacterium radiodurans]|uniref:Rhodanese domain-containing protein n=1 Tax=Microbacterium radiodurans TaxID=661398 RepID=A0A5J5IR88_9MICO|nr:ThiF family adenylyltransferase [Microbacterium radiodurans]KAA9085180.1 hypothetical protein F6B42_11860 [Microbacterium radiodurans]
MPLPPLVAPADAISAAERERTARHAVLAGFGEIGQRRLAAARVAVIGAGGLGSPVILALAAAGVGSITVIDDDIVERTNLQRQIVHREGDVGAPKVDSVVRAVADLSPETRVLPRRERLTAANAEALIADADLVIDGSDTFETRTAVADACRLRGTPLVWGVVQEFHAQVTVFWSQPPAGIPPVVLGDLYPAGSVGELPTCSDVGVLGALCIQVGGMLVSEAIKLVTGIGEPLLGRVAVIDSLAATQREIPLRAAQSRDPLSAPPRVAAAATRVPAPVEVDLAHLREAQRAGATVLDVREPDETARDILPGSVLIPLGDLLADPDRVPRTPVVVVCERGARADRAARELLARGIDASVLTGGLAAWR